MLTSLLALTAAGAAGGLGDVLTPTPGHIVKTHANLVHACMSDATIGAAWFVMAVCALAAISFFGWAQSINKRFRGFHMFAFYITLIPAMAYITMLSGYGINLVGAPFGNRCFFDARAVSLILEVPLLLVVAGLLAGAAAMDITLGAIGAFLAMTSAMLGGSMDSNNRWFLFLFSVLFAVPVLRTLWNSFGVTSGDAVHEYSDLIASKVSWMCNILMSYILIQVLFWSLCQGANLMSPATELLVLGLVDAVFLTTFCVTLVSNREVVEKMGEVNARGMGWLRGNEYSSIESRGEERPTTQRGVASGAR